VDYKEVIAVAIQKESTKSIHIHPMNNDFILEIDYEPIVDSIVANLEQYGYTIITKGSSSVG
jgi:hypothetical protein